MIAWQGVCIHHSATDDGETLSWPVIDYNHRQKGWAAIGYHFGIEKHARKVDGKMRSSVQVLQGRPLYRIGAHTRGQNNRLIGICLIGNFDLGPVPDGVWDKAVDLVATLCLLFDWRHPLGPYIRMHCDFARKSCPGKQFSSTRFIIDVMNRLSLLKTESPLSPVTADRSTTTWFPSGVRPL